MCRYLCVHSDRAQRLEPTTLVLPLEYTAILDIFVICAAFDLDESAVQNGINCQLGSRILMTANDDAQSDLLKRAAAGDSDAEGELLDSHRTQLERMVRLRMHDRVRARVNPSDVIQETFLEASRRLKEFADNPSVTFYVWLRFLANQRLAQLHRHHLDRRVRTAFREVAIDDAGNLSWTSEGLVNQLAGTLTSPVIAAQKAELRARLLEVLNEMDDLDREIIVLRHFEQLSNAECAGILNLTPTAASNRYIRALERLRKVLGGQAVLPERG